MLKPCKSCGKSISAQALLCPSCGVSPTIEKGMNAILVVILIMVSLAIFLVLDLWLGDAIALTILALIVGWLLYAGARRFRVGRQQRGARGDATRKMLREHEMRERAHQAVTTL